MRINFESVLVESEQIEFGRKDLSTWRLVGGNSSSIL